MATKKQPTRKQLAARAKFARMVKARAREAAAAKRKAGYRLVKGKWIAPKQNSGKARKAKQRRRDDIRQQTIQRMPSPQYEKARAVEAKQYKKLVRKLDRRAKSKGKAGRKYRAAYSAYNGASVVKNGRRLYGAAAAAVLAKRAQKNGSRGLARSRRMYESAKRAYVKSGSKSDAKRISSSSRRVQLAAAKGIMRPGSGKHLMNPRGHHVAGVTAKGQQVYKAMVKSGTSKSIAAATVKKRYPSKRRNSWLGSQFKQAIGKRLHAPIRLRRKRNQGTPADIAAMHEKFLGRPTEGHFDITAPQGTPKDVAVLGSLVCLKTEDEDFEFDKGEAYLGADGRGNLYVLGDTTPVETNTNFGHIEEIRYEAKKDHLNPFKWRRRKSRRNSSNVEYFHYFGEEDGVMPKLKSDSDGLLHISGGNYKVEAEGIVN